MSFLCFLEVPDQLQNNMEFHGVGWWGPTHYTLDRVVVHILRVYGALPGRLRLCTCVQPYCPALPLFTLLYF